MIYGLYLSANGVMTNAHRQDVIANNLANVETTAFKRDITSFRQRLTEAQALNKTRLTNPVLDHIGGGLLVSPGSVDRTQGDLEATGNNLDVAIEGRGYFAVADGKETRLTRDGRFAIDREGFLVMNNGVGQKVLDRNFQPIQLDGRQRHAVVVGEYGQVTQHGEPVAQIGLFDVPDPQNLAKRGGNLLGHAGDPRKLPAAPARTRAEFVERSNVDPAAELTQLMDAQRQLEANANMIRYQDATLAKLVNEVGKIT
jgi:flagellar basal-body rod protein FlgB